eukprot:1188735-Prorocentrum_minimum.AAC.2
MKRLTGESVGLGRWLRWTGHKTKHFNVGKYRRHISGHSMVRRRPSDVPKSGDRSDLRSRPFGVSARNRRSFGAALSPLRTADSPAGSSLDTHGA